MGPGGLCCGLIFTGGAHLVLQILLDSAVAHLGPVPTRLVFRKCWSGPAAVVVPLRLVRSSSRSGYFSSPWLVVLSLLFGAPGAVAQVPPPRSASLMSCTHAVLRKYAALSHRISVQPCVRC